MRKSTALRSKLKFCAAVSTERQLTEALACSNIERVYVPMALLKHTSELRDHIHEKCVAVPAAFIGGNETEMREHLCDLKRRGLTAALAHTIGHIELIKQAQLQIHGGMRLNITNSSALAQYAALGVYEAVVSIELGLRNMKSLTKPIPCGFIAYGKLPLMLFRRSNTLLACDTLTDRLGKRFELLRNADYDEAELLNSVPLVLSDKLSDFERCSLDFAVLLLSPDESVLKVVDMYLRGDIPTKDFTRGLYYK